uniref:Isoform 16 of cAMP-responsive element modulator n=1 Tax=Homo sapiens TaxID=9606 RepID=Q03060-19
MSKCARKKYIKTNPRQMTMETVESQHDGSITASLTESKSAHVQTQTGQNSIPALAQVDEETELAPSHMAAATGDMPTYQIRAPTAALPQGVVMAASPGSLHSPQQLAEEATRKRELRLMKNREAAKECRRRKKEYVKCLESRVAVLEVQNKKLIEELETLKDICSPKTDY